MEYIFLFAIVTPLALLVLNLTGFRAAADPADAAPASEAPVVVPAVPVAEPVVTAGPAFTPALLAASSVPSTLTGALRPKRHRRDFFGDYTPMATVESFASEPVHEGAEIYLMPRRETVAAGTPTGQGMPVGTIVSLPSHTPLVAQQSAAQR